MARCGFTTEGPKPPSSPLGVLANLADIRSVTIWDSWMGLSEVGPISKRYELKPEGSQFVGKAFFSLGGGDSVKTKEAPMTVPSDTMRKFFSVLALSPLVKGEYKPLIEHTDDYPEVKIDVETASGKLSFFSKSQGDLAVPWGAFLGGESYTINDKKPMEAFKLLAPYVKEEEFKRFYEETRNSFRGKRR